MALVHDAASIVIADAGIVMATGPDNVQICFTAKAALETASRLITAAAEALGQKMFTDELVDRDELCPPLQ